MALLEPERPAARPGRRLALVALALAAALALACAAAAPAVAGGTDYVYVLRWTTRPDQDLLAGSAYTAWSRTAIPRCLAVPGLSGLNTYRAAAGEPHIITLFGFATLPALAAWRGSRELEELTEESRQFTYETRTEIWGPSPYGSRLAGSAPPSASATGHVVHVFAWNVYPPKRDAYGAWITRALATWAKGPGIESVAAYRVVVGERTDVFICEFADFASWAKWYESTEVQRTRLESRELVVDARTELWGPNPLYPTQLTAPDVRADSTGDTRGAARSGR